MLPDNPWVILSLFIVLSFVFTSSSERISLILFFVLFAVLGSGYDYLRKWFVFHSKTSQEVIDFPVYEFTEAEYKDLRQKIEPFFQDVLEDRSSELCLTVNQLNCIYARGCNTKKWRDSFPKFPTYFEIENNKLIENNLTYPTVNLLGYQINIWCAEFNGTTYSAELIYPAEVDDEFVIATSVLPFKDLKLFTFLCEVDKVKMERLAKKLTSVEIVDDKLILKVGFPSNGKTQ